ncbi:MAG: hypothetical protein COA57_15405 [Flavobacteriales bacterium]|nr:MAG: hypothetical protein COA57_15405 [Flavobacteriales bacterium]
MSDIFIGEMQGTLQKEICNIVGDFRIQSDASLGTSNTVINSDNAGFVGIGTPNPTERLSVNGSVGVSGDLKASNIVASGNLRVQRILPVAGDSVIHIGDSSIVINGSSNSITVSKLVPPGVVGNATLYIQNQPFSSQTGTPVNHTVLNPHRGKVGIGTTVPDERLSVGGNDPVILLEDLTASGSNQTEALIKFGRATLNQRWAKIGMLSGDNDLHISAGENGFGGVSLETNNVQRVYVNKDGKVGIGTSTPGSDCLDACSRQKLDVRGDGRFGHISGSYTRIGFNGANSIIDAYDNIGSRNLLINYFSGGNVSIGNAAGSNNPSDLFVSGNTEVKGNLDVCGEIGASNVVVENPWCDFAFAPDYQHMHWKTKEEFYTDSMRLPYVDSEPYILQHGLDLGKNMEGMMLNVEENRLDITELYKRLERLEKENKDLKAELLESKEK